MSTPSTPTSPTTATNANVKLIFLGPTGTGKSSLISRYVNPTTFDVATPTTVNTVDASAFTINNAANGDAASTTSASAAAAIIAAKIAPTVGMDLKTKVLTNVKVSDEVSYNRVKVIMMDLAGLVVYKEAIRSAYTSLDSTKTAVAIVVDLFATSGEEAAVSAIVAEWLKEVATVSKGAITPQTVPFVLVGTKGDVIEAYDMDAAIAAKATLETVSKKFHLQKGYVTTAASISTPASPDVSTTNEPTATEDTAVEDPTAVMTAIAMLALTAVPTAAPTAAATKKDTATNKNNEQSSSSPSASTSSNPNKRGTPPVNDAPNQRQQKAKTGCC